ncbi:MULTISPECIES: iron-containing alcohol dehydrogenase [unclassified Haladaptatus]|uniref:iron-containing alcohol dehydrogenase n=1 Tax=unclassified Haladaptatus TaxID=2622732 RepID=UPI0023E8AA79|nr:MULTISPECIES: iron-containing alcohol dehydrogenase [unclassified Haladaptatus]
MTDGVSTITETYSIHSPAAIRYGVGATEELVEFATTEEVERALVVTDEDIVAAGVVEPVVTALERADVTVSTYDGVKPEPKLSMVEDVVSVLAEDDFDLVLGVGGGSSMDTAKVAAALAVHDVPIRSVVGMGNVPGKGLPLVLLPTTAGTGSEVTHIGVFSDAQDGGNKVVVYSEHLFADLAIVDPALTESLPKPVAAATGMDALTHAIEAYVTMLRTPYSDGLARQAIELLGNNLRAAVHQGPNNDEARYNVSFAATIAGQAFVNSGLGAVHALTYPLGIEYGIGHGLANAVLLPHVMAYNLPAEPERYAEIARLLGEERESGDTTLDMAKKSVDAVFALNEDIGIPTQIRDLGEIDREEFTDFADTCFEYSKHNIDRNPRSLTREDVVEIFENAY